MRRIELQDGAYLELAEGWLTPALAGELLAQLCAELPFEARAIRIYGREVLQPRLTAWLGDPEAVYTYSGTRHEPRPLTPALEQLRGRLARELGVAFNSVLANLYRDGRDAMGMHRDAEPELGREPVIASLSLGATRRFVLHHRRGAKHHRLALALASGTLLVMRGTTQAFYRHGVPRESGSCAARVNLTFRRVDGVGRG